jgi:beta-lactamase regulating signal transducer with metallopeptidase domain
MSAMANFVSILVTGIATGVVFALLLLRFVSGSFFAAMGDACGGVFAAAHGFLAASNWNYLMAIIVAAVLLSQMVFLVGGGSWLLRVSHGEKARRRDAGISCPALQELAGKKWASYIRVVPGDRRLEALTVGLLKPRIMISEGLIQGLEGNELEAVVLHEESHRAARDNLFAAAAKAVTLTLFYLPGPRLAFREMRKNLEHAADHKAAGNPGGKLAVASALSRIADSGTVMAPGDLSLSVAVTGNGKSLTARLEDLLLGKEDSSRRWHRPMMFAVGALAVTMIFVSSALAVAGSDQREAFICFTQHEQGVNSDGICDLDHPIHP